MEILVQIVGSVIAGLIVFGLLALVPAVRRRAKRLWVWWKGIPYRTAARPYTVVPWELFAAIALLLASSKIALDRDYRNPPGWALLVLAIALVAAAVFVFVFGRALYKGRKLRRDIEHLLDRHRDQLDPQDRLTIEVSVASMKSGTDLAAILSHCDVLLGDPILEKIKDEHYDSWIDYLTRKC